MKTVLIFTSFLFFNGFAFGQEKLKVLNVVAEVNPNNNKQIIISFDIATPYIVDWYDVEIRCSLDGGKTFSTFLRSVKFKNEYYEGISPLKTYDGNRLPEGTISTKAYWNVLKDLPSLDNKQVVFEVQVRRNYDKVKTKDRELPRMVLVKGGKFEYKKPVFDDDENSEKTTAEVKDFYIGRYELTYEDFIRYKFFWSRNRIRRESRPNGRLIFVLVRNRTTAALCEGNLNLYLDICKWMNGRLPSYKEWLYAAKGGIHQDNYVYSGSSNVREVAQLEGRGNHFYLEFIDGQRSSVPVGQKKPNKLEIYDMTGNVAELVKMYFTPNKTSEENPWGQPSNTEEEKENTRKKNKRKRRQKKKKVANDISKPDKPVARETFAYGALGGGFDAKNDQMQLGKMHQNFKLLSTERDFKHTGVRLVKDIPPWKDTYITVFSGGVKVGSYQTNVITTEFQMSDSEITNEAYAQFLNFDNVFPDDYRLLKWINLKGNYAGRKCRIYFKDGYYKVETGFEQEPVVFVSHLGARAYAMWRGGRLPTEMELKQAQQQDKLNNQKCLLWCQDSYNIDYLETLKSGTENPINTVSNGQHTVLDNIGKRKGYFSENFYPEVGFRVVLLR
ncbi:MAG TPA: hypothetical protein DCS93_44155 [Microscillaceae bacterium]|nr:hypothetical protein [Microscillaceae bacterium]